MLFIRVADGTTTIIVAVLFPITLLLMIYHLYYTYKVLTAKCRVCGKKIEGQWGRKIVYVYTPWRKIKFICLDCQKKKKKKFIISKCNKQTCFQS